MIYKGEYRDLKMIIWIINEYCNFHCDYCVNESYKNKSDLKPIDIYKLKESLDFLGRDWLINISGGEPFLEKNFTDICQEVTKKHYLLLNTNLSTANVFDFADRIDPERCLNIWASVHVAEREKRDIKFASFIEKMLYLQSKNFNVIAYYVTHPLYFDRIKSDIAYLKSNGIQKVRNRIYIGWYNNKYYPDSFSAEQKIFLESMEADYPEFEILNKPQTYWGQLCMAGKRGFVMDRTGNLKRCFSTQKSYGNLFEKAINYDKRIKPCPKNNCICPIEGIRNSIDTRGNIFSILKEDFIERSLVSKQQNIPMNKFRKLKVAWGNTINKMSVKYFIHIFWRMISALEKAGIPFSKIKKSLIKSGIIKEK